jgi:hypothetical protein
VSALIQTNTIDAILAFQITVAWSGESREQTIRPGWTDLVDATGGGDLLARLLHCTHALDSVRDATRRVDQWARSGRADQKSALERE